MMMSESQLAPFFDMLDEGPELPIPPADGPQPDPTQGLTRESGPDIGSSPIIPLTSDTVSPEMKAKQFLKDRLGFDEVLYREKCQRSQTEICAEFKKIVDETYDELDALVSQHSKALYEMQAKIAKDCEDKIIKIKEMALQAISGEESIKGFLSQVKTSYESMLGKLRQ